MLLLSPLWIHQEDGEVCRGISKYLRLGNHGDLRAMISDQPGSWMHHEGGGSKIVYRVHGVLPRYQPKG